MRREQSHKNVCVLCVICWIEKKNKASLKRDLFLKFSFFSENKDKKEKSLLYTHITMFPHFNFLQMCKAHLDIVKYFFFLFIWLFFFPKGDLIFTHMLMPCTSYLYLCFLHTWLFTRSEVCVKVNTGHLMIMYHKFSLYHNFFFFLTFFT